MKRVLSVILSIVMMLGIAFSVDVSALALSKSGVCGDNAKYTFNSSTGKLVISGSGEIYDYYNNESPFDSQIGIKSVVINYGITKIGDSTFNGCTNLISVEIPDSVVDIGCWSFIDCTSLSSVIIGNGVKSIRAYAFYRCTNLKSILFYGTEEQWKNISMGNNAVPSTVKISFHTHQYLCVESKSSTCTEQGYNLYRCELCDSEYKELLALGHLVEESVIENYIESTCTVEGSYDEVVYCSVCKSEISRVNKTKDVIEHDFGDGTDYNCKVCGAYNPEYFEIGKCGENLTYALNKSSGELIISGVGNTYNFSADGSPFCNRTDIKSVVINEGVNGISTYTFYNCTNLESAVLADSVTFIGYCAFLNCGKMKRITIGKNLETIGSYAFSNCRSLNNMVLPKKIIELAYYAFDECTSLRNMYYLGTEKEWNDVTIYDNSIPGWTTINYHVLCDYSIVIENIEPACTKTGSQTLKCSICGDVAFYSLVMLGHDYIEKIIPPTHSVEGYKRYSCIRCGDTYTTYSDDLKAIGHICSEYLYMHNGVITYRCECGEANVNKLANEVVDMWSIDLINASADECPELDIVNDGIINAKDFALLRNLQRNK